jgi:hypothetical protein
MYDQHRIQRFLSELFDANAKALARLFDPNNVPDRVVRSVLDQGIVRESEVKPVYNLWILQAESSAEPKRLWRMVAEAVPGKAELIRAVAAQVYAFQEAVISTSDAVSQMEMLFDNWSVAQWRELRDLKCLPVRGEAIADSTRTRFVFASHDPTRVTLRSTIEDLGVDDYELCYTPDAVISYIGDQLEAIIKKAASRPAPAPAVPTDTADDEPADQSSIKAA